MRRYLLVLVTIAVVLSLALVGCVGTQPQPPQPPDGGGGDGGGTPEPTPTEFVPSPADGAKVLAGSKVTFDWSTWEEAKNATWFRFHYAWGDCDEEPDDWDYVQENKDPCCPLETKYATTLNQCGVFWWKVEICTDEGTKVKGPFKVCSVPGFLVELVSAVGTPTVLASAVVSPEDENATLQLDACKLPSSFNIRVTAKATTTLCATTTYKVELSSLAKSGPWFTLSGTTTDATDTWNSGTTVDEINLTTVEASEVVCTAMFGETIATVSFTVFPDIPGAGCCPTETHCCKTEYKVNIVLEGDEPELDLWASCDDCGGPCTCGWLVLKMNECFTLVATDTGARTPDATIIIRDENGKFIEISPEELESATHTDMKVINKVRHYFWCLDGMDQVGMDKVTSGSNYTIGVNKGAFKFTNGEVTFGWPCADKEFNVTAK